MTLSGWLPWAPLSALFAAAFLGERPGLREWLGIALVGGGVLLLSLRSGQ